MNELNKLRRLNKSIISFTDSQFCPYVDIDSGFYYTNFSKFFSALFNSNVNVASEHCLNEKSFSEHVVDIYLSKVINLRSSLFMYLYNLSSKNENEQNIRRLESMSFDESEFFFGSCKENYLFVVKHLLEKGFDANTINDQQRLSSSCRIKKRTHRNC